MILSQDSFDKKSPFTKAEGFVQAKALNKTQVEICARFQSYDTYRKSRAMTSSDRNQQLHGLLEKIESTTDKKAAMDLCEKVRIQAKNGRLY